MATAGSAKRAVGDAARAGQRAQQSRAFGVLVTVGLIAYGLVHLLIAWIALQIAWTGSGKEASQKGAFAQLAGNSVGLLLLWVTAVGLFALAIWQGAEAIWGHREREPGIKRIRKRLGSAGKAVIYAGLGVSAISTAAGSSSSSSGSEKTLAARLLGLPFGRILVIAIGLAVVVVGGRLVYRGVKKKFTRDLEGQPSPGVTRLGMVGYTAKGIALGIVGVLFVAAAVTYNPDKAGGPDAALRTLGSQPYGTALLTLMAVGIAAFGAYCFAWSRRAKTS